MDRLAILANGFNDKEEDRRTTPITALDSLARYLQMFKDTLVVENVFRVVQEMDDDELDRRLAELERALGEAKTLDPVSVH